MKLGECVQQWPQKINQILEG